MANILVHKHLIIKADVNNAPKNPEEAKKWVSALIKKINMKVMMGPFSEYCEMEGNRGLTAVAIIETSHIAMHSWDECQPHMLQLDVYSCGHIDVDAIISHLEEFEPVKVQYKFLDRETNLTLLSEKD